MKNSRVGKFLQVFFLFSFLLNNSATMFCAYDSEDFEEAELVSKDNKPKKNIFSRFKDSYM